MRIHHVRSLSVLAGALALVLASAGLARAEDSLQDLTGSTAGTGQAVTSSPGAGEEQLGAPEGQGGSETDRWWRWYRYRYYQHYHYYPPVYYRPVHYRYVYPVAPWRPYVVIFDGADKSAGAPKDTIPDTTPGNGK